MHVKSGCMGFSSGTSAARTDCEISMARSLQGRSGRRAALFQRGGLAGIRAPVAPPDVAQPAREQAHIRERADSKPGRPAQGLHRDDHDDDSDDGGSDEKEAAHWWSVRWIEWRPRQDSNLRPDA